MWYLGLEDISINLAIAKTITIETDALGTGIEVVANYTDGSKVALRSFTSYDEAARFKTALFSAMADGVVAASSGVIQLYMDALK